MALVNLYKETLEFMEEHGYTKEDVLHVTNSDRSHYLDMDRFRIIADQKYQNVVYHAEHTAVAKDVVLVFNDGNYLIRSMKDEGELSVECWDIRKPEEQEQILDVFCRMVNLETKEYTFDFKDKLKDYNEFEENVTPSEDEDGEAENSTNPLKGFSNLSKIDEIHQHARFENILKGKSHLEKKSKGKKLTKKVVL